MKKYIFILILILSLTFVSAENFDLKKNRVLNNRGVSFELLSVGSSGSIYLQINSQKKLIDKDGELVLYDLQIKNLYQDPSTQTARISLELLAECISDGDCEKIKPQHCMNATCNYRICEFEAIGGCPFENDCKRVSSFEDINNVLSYCAIDFEWKPRKSYKDTCEHSYECLSNSCNGKCSTLILGGKKMAPSWILIVIGGLLLIEALFIFLRPNLAKRIIKNSSFWRKETWRVIAVLETIIALVLIIWALT